MAENNCHIFRRLRDLTEVPEKHGDPVYDFIKKKQDEGKAFKVAKIAGFNKF